MDKRIERTVLDQLLRFDITVGDDDQLLFNFINDLDNVEIIMNIEDITHMTISNKFFDEINIKTLTVGEYKKLIYKHIK